MEHTGDGLALIDDQTTLNAAMAVIARARRIGVDTEADSRHHYPEKVCLIQVEADGQNFLIDPLARLDLSAFGPVLADPSVEKILHGADFDLRGLHRDWGFTVSGLYDTNVAAKFAGLERLGLAALIEDLLGVTIPKDLRLRRADWSKRPLSAEALGYAVEDVVHIGAVRDAVAAKVVGLGRQTWAAEEFTRLEEVRYEAPDPETVFFGVKGTHALDGKGLAVLKELYELRDAEARRADRPPAFVIPAEALVHICAHPDAELDTVPGLATSVLRRLGRDLKRAIEIGVAAPPIARPAPPYPFRPRPTSAQAKRLQHLKDWRIAEGTKLALDPSLLWPMRSMERLAREPGTLDSELESSDVRAWQQQAGFADSLRAVLARS
jgi:ribonuclease D